MIRRLLFVFLSAAFVHAESAAAATCDSLASLPGFLYDGRLADIDRLLDDVELAEPVRLPGTAG